jgi:hypothetical protein
MTDLGLDARGVEQMRTHYPGRMKVRGVLHVLMVRRGKERKGHEDLWKPGRTLKRASKLQAI